MAIDVVEPRPRLTSPDLRALGRLEFSDDRQPPLYARIACLPFFDPEQVNQSFPALCGRCRPSFLADAHRRPSHIHKVPPAPILNSVALIGESALTFGKSSRRASARAAPGLGQIKAQSKLCLERQSVFTKIRAT